MFSLQTRRTESTWSNPERPPVIAGVDVHQWWSREKRIEVHRGHRHQVNRVDIDVQTGDLGNG
jgi:hypothetical protein